MGRCTFKNNLTNKLRKKKKNIFFVLLLVNVQILLTSLFVQVMSENDQLIQSIQLQFQETTRIILSMILGNYRWCIFLDMRHQTNCLLSWNTNRLWKLKIKPIQSHVEQCFYLLTLSSFMVETSLRKQEFRLKMTKVFSIFICHSPAFSMNIYIWYHLQQWA